MKLTGSITEGEYRADLVRSKKYLFESPEGRRIFDVLHEIYGQFRSAYVLSHTPEQGEDIFRILIDAQSVVGFDLPHEGGKAKNVSVMPFNAYDHMLGKSREGRLRLSIALVLAKEDMLLTP